MKYKKIAKKLWNILDDIDSLSDIIRPNDLNGYKEFYKIAMDKVNLRHNYLESDGYNLTKNKKELQLKEKALDNTNTSDAKKTTNDIKVFGNPDLWELICKASSKEQGWMKSTKAMEIGTLGVMVLVSTEFANPDGSKSVSETSTFISNARIVDGKDGLEIV